ncbi:MAG: hypothetical protein ABI308_16250, partial [Mucilaginibacter sp.]
ERRRRIAGKGPPLAQVCRAGKCAKATCAFIFFWLKPINAMLYGPLVKTNGNEIYFFWGLIASLTSLQVIHCRPIYGAGYK